MSTTCATSVSTAGSVYATGQHDELLYDSNDSSPDGSGGLHSFDFTSYIDCEASPWLSLEDHPPSPTSSPANTTSSSYNHHAERHHHNRRVSYNKHEDNETVQLNRRREQNRLSQKNFRQRKGKLYDEVVAQLEAEREVVSRLKSEITILNSTVVSLQREKQTSLAAVVRLCRSMYDFPEPMMKYGHEG